MREKTTAQAKETVKDVLKNNQKELEIDVDDWEALTKNRALWRKLISFKRKRVKQAELKCALRKQDDSAVPADVTNELKCSVCGHLLLSTAGLVNHLKSHRQWSNEEVDEGLCQGARDTTPVLHVA